MNKSNRTTSFLYVVLVYVVAFYGARWSLLNLDFDWIQGVLVADVAATVIVFIGSLLVRNSSVYDPYWSVAPVPIAYYILHSSESEPSLRNILILFAVWFWALRLTLNWARGWHGLSHEDWRYGSLAEKTGSWYWLVSFSGIHMFPTLCVFVGCLPLFYAIPSDGIGWLDFVACTLAIVGALIELVADEQMRTFKKKNNDPTAVMESGIWKYMRHPNYLGEITFWLGIYLFALAANYEYWWTGVGFLAMVILFVFISIPMMDKHHVQKRPGYADIMKRRFAMLPFRKG